MIVYLKNTEIDREHWDTCLKNSGVGKPYPYSWYLDIMAPGWEALIDDDYDSLFPVPAREILGLKFTTTPVFVQQLGAYSPDKPAISALTEFLDYMPEIFRVTDLSIGQKTDYPGYWIRERQNYVINLSYTYGTLAGRFTPDCRSIILSGTRKKIMVVSDVTPEEMTGLCIANRKLSGVNAGKADYEKLGKLMKHCLKTKKGRILGVRTYGRKLIYGIFLIHLHGSITVIAEAHTPRSIERNLSYHVINGIIKEHSASMKILDLAGASLKSSTPAGIMFGGMAIPYYRICRNRILWPFRHMT
jgi:hypothetical protein